MKRRHHYPDHEVDSEYSTDSSTISRRSDSEDSYPSSDSESYPQKALKVPRLLCITNAILRNNFDVKGLAKEQFRKFMTDKLAAPGWKEQPRRPEYRIGKQGRILGTRNETLRSPRWWSKWEIGLCCNTFTLFKRLQSGSNNDHLTELAAHWGVYIQNLEVLPDEVMFIQVEIEQIYYVIGL